MREANNWDPVPYQWAAAGYGGAIGSGKATCGILVGGAIYLGYLSGTGASREPGVKDDARMQAMARVSELYRKFINQFGDTDCKALTGCDWSKKEDAERFYRDKVNLTTCGKQFDYVLTALLSGR